MKLVDAKLELTILKTITDKNTPKGIRYKTLAVLKDSHFQTDIGKEIFERISKLTGANSEIPTTSELAHDPIISEVTRSVFKRQKIDSNIEDKQARRLFDKLDKFRKARELYFIHEKIGDVLEQDKIDIDAVIENVTEKMSNIRQASTDSEFFHMGRNNNTGKLLDKMLNRKEANLLATGFAAFDNVNGGFAKGSLVSIAGNTGSGKSAFAIQLSKNMVELNTDVIYVPLEMDEEEVMERLLANISGVPALLIKRAKLKERHKEKIRESYLKWCKKLKKNKSRFTVWPPINGITISELINTVTPLNPEMLIVDYMSLLKMEGRKDQWKELGDVAWTGKTWAKENNKVCALLAQINDEGRLRYSQTLKEHSNNMLSWVATKETREQKIMLIQQEKARNQMMFDFALGYDDELYRVFDIDQSILEINKTKKKDSDKKESNIKPDYLKTAE